MGHILCAKVEHGLFAVDVPARMARGLAYLARLENSPLELVEMLHTEHH